MTECKGERKRAYAPKTRSGCKTCKLRRIKCDEAKPACKRCTSTGRQCDGYAVSQNALVSLRPVNILPKEPLNTIIGARGLEGQLNFFADQIAPKIAGFYDDLDFWKVKVVQLGHTEPAIRLAIQAVSSLHAEVEKAQGNTIANVNPTILRDYNNAIRHLVQSSSDPLYVKAVVVALFVCLEFLAGNEDAAAIHINGGLKLLQDWKTRSKSQSPDSSSSSNSSPRSGTDSEQDLMDDLSSTFSRLALHSKVFGKRMLWIDVPGTERAHDYHYLFETMNQARDEAFAILDEAIDFISRGTPVSYTEQGVDESFYAEQRVLIARTLQWRKSFKEFSRREQMNFTQMQIRAGNMVQCLIICTYIWACTCLSPYEEDYDKFTPEFQEVIDLSRTIVEIPQEYLCNNIGRFQIDMGLIPALHLTGTRCRVPSIRQAAVEILSTHHWREGLFDSFRSSQFIIMCTKLEEAAKQKLMGLEPHELADYLPCEGARIHFVGVDKQITNEKGVDTLLHSFYSKPYGAFGDWHVQQCHLPASPLSVNIANPSPTELQAVPHSAYQMPHMYVGTQKKSGSYSHQKDAAFCPEMLGNGTTERNQTKLMNVMVHSDENMEFTVPHNVTQTLGETSNGMFYMHLVGATPLVSQWLQPQKHTHSVLL
ncbi:uncharacterized protein PV09_00174 [Verruconis gallopava]|uniref:Zn(2)-C6 fungal-type domain-containing protein n=1 Tax=Verruconis gallopava TaxID=253628 RepID=A0A0D2ARU0_9PEZI|nr:uncharacterized protein PV09_00174 [Verruconis gallopava]KIW09250.1 hypothetical protein PV09_00174 [Verruconis gallopava]